MPLDYGREIWLTLAYEATMQPVVSMIGEVFSGRPPPSKELIDHYLAMPLLHDRWVGELLQQWPEFPWENPGYDTLRSVVYDHIFINADTFPYILPRHMLASIIVYRAGRSVAEQGNHVSALVTALKPGPFDKWTAGRYASLTVQELQATRTVIDLLCLRIDEIGWEARQARETWLAVTPLLQLDIPPQEEE